MMRLGYSAVNSTVIPIASKARTSVSTLEFFRLRQNSCTTDCGMTPRRRASSALVIPRSFIADHSMAFIAVTTGTVSVRWPSFGLGAAGTI